MEVKVFLDSSNHPRFTQMLRKFAAGVRSSGDDVYECSGMYSDCDVAVIFGSWKDRDTLWHNTKRDVVSKAKNFICIEMPLVGREEVKYVGEDTWYRVGVNGFLADTGNFNNKRKPSDRWEKVQKELDVELKPYREDGNFILVTLQVPGDASLRGNVIEDWAYDVCHKIRKYSNRPILIRTPQILKTFNLDRLYQINDELSDIDYQIGEKKNLIPTLEKAWATVTYSSGMGVDSYMNGVPSFTMDKGNFAYCLGNTNLKHIESPSLPKRDQWLHNLCYAQWDEEEMESGRCWQHIRKVINE